MNMDKKTEDFQVENMLENWQKKPLDDQALLAAQNRVWSKIQAKTSNSNLVSNNLSNISMADNQNNAAQISPSNITKPLKPWYLRTLTLSVSAFAVVLMAAGIGSMVYLNQQNQKLAEQLALQKELQNSKVAINPVSKTDLSLDEIRGLATTKLNAITGGVPLDEIQSSLAKAPLASNKMSPTGSGGGPSTSKVADAPTPETLFKEKNINNVADKTVYYTEDITTEKEEGFSYSYLNTNPNYDKKKPVKTQSWTSTNYSKYVLSQDDKIISYNVYSINYGIDYRGGKFAIKENFDNSQYFNGLSSPVAGTVDNSELGWLKSLLSDKSLKDEGLVKIDGKDYKVLATDPNFNVDTNSKMAVPVPTEDQYVTKYFIDISKFSLYKTETYLGKTLKSQTVRSGYQEINNPDLSNLFSGKDLKNIPIKEVQGYVSGDIESSVANFVTKYKIIIPDGSNIKTNNLYAFDASLYNESESSKLRNSIDFDPNADPNYLESIKSAAQGTYSIMGISANINKIEPGELQGIDLISETKKQFKIDGQSISGVLKSYNYSQGDNGDENVTKIKSAPITPSKIPSNFELAFKDPDTNLFYSLIEYTDPNTPNIKSVLSKKDLSFTTLDIVTAKSIDIYQKGRNESYPQLNDVDFNAINAENRLIPGDLLKSYEIKASNFSKSTRVTGVATCDKYLDSVYSIDSCLIDKYNGFTLFYNQVKQDTPNFTYLNYSFLNTKYEDLDIGFLVNKIRENSDTEAKINIEKTDSYSTIVFKDYNNVDNYLFFFKLKDKTVLLNTNLDKNKVTKIVSEIALDKDLSALNIQIQKSKASSCFDGHDGYDNQVCM
jgi:hypothetical protein